MSEEIKKRGRQPGQVVIQKEKGYIQIKEDLRIKVEIDCLTIEQKIGVKDNEIVWGNNRYFNSWNGVIGWLVRRFSTDKISKKDVLSFKEAKKDILDSINEVKQIMLSEIECQMELASDEINSNIIKYAKK